MSAQYDWFGWRWGIWVERTNWSMWITLTSNRKDWRRPELDLPNEDYITNKLIRIAPSKWSSLYSFFTISFSINETTKSLHLSSQLESCQNRWKFHAGNRDNSREGRVLLYRLASLSLLFSGSVLCYCFKQKNKHHRIRWQDYFGGLLLIDLDGLYQHDFW